MSADYTFLCPGRSHRFDCTAPYYAVYCDSIFPDCWACRFCCCCDNCNNKSVCETLKAESFPLGSLDTPVEPF